MSDDEPAISLINKSKEGLTKAKENYSKARTVAEEIVGQWVSVLISRQRLPPFRAADSEPLPTA
jgi:hypothetical protein